MLKSLSVQESTLYKKWQEFNKDEYKMRTKAYKASDLYDTDTNNENGEIEKEFINIQRNIKNPSRYNLIELLFRNTQSILKNR